tara:strand:+ start:154 stop:1758 length:1605 start_codon:yes stop_codon:yes gene_type:complete
MVNSQTPFSGTTVKYYENGGLEFRQIFKNGLLNGPSEFFHKNGEIEAKVSFKDGLDDGFSEAFYDNGQLKERYNGVKGKLNGQAKTFYKNGQLIASTQYTLGLLDPGTYDFFRDDGSIEKKLRVISKDYRYVQNFSKNGIVLSEGEQKNRLKNDVWKMYFNDGILKETQEYKLGKIDGSRELFYENGILKSKGNYVNSEYSWVGMQKQGLWQFYDESGKLEAEKTYKDDELTGYFKERHLKNGRLWWYEGEMLYGKYWGKIDRFNEEGHLVERRQYGSENEGTWDYIGHGHLTGWSVDYNPNGSIAKSYCYAKGQCGVCDGVSLEDFSGVPPDEEVITPIFTPVPKHPRKARKFCGIATVKFGIRTNGGISSIQLSEEIPEGKGFGESAMQAARDLNYKSRSCTKSHFHTFIFEKENCKNRDDLELLSTIGLEVAVTSEGVGDKDFLVIYAPQPQYPRRAQTRGKEGYAVVEVTITKTGGVRNIIMVEEFPEGWGFGRSAVKAAKKLKYTPRVFDEQFQEVPNVLHKFNFQMAK